MKRKPPALLSLTSTAVRPPNWKLWSWRSPAFAKVTGKDERGVDGSGEKYEHGVSKCHRGGWRASATKSPVTSSAAFGDRSAIEEELGEETCPAPPARCNSPRPVQPTKVDGPALPRGLPRPSECSGGEADVDVEFLICPPPSLAASLALRAYNGASARLRALMDGGDSAGGFPLLGGDVYIAEAFEVSCRESFLNFHPHHCHLIAEPRMAPLNQRQEMDGRVLRAAG